MDPSVRRPTLLRDPSSLFFQADTIRRYIIGSYWLIIILALPLWWSTTSIERLSLPTSHVISRAQHHLSIPVTLSLQADVGGAPLASQLRKSIDERISKAPDRWKGLDIHVNYDRILGMSTHKTYVHVNLPDQPPKIKLFRTVCTRSHWAQKNLSYKIGS